MSCKSMYCTIKHERWKFHSKWKSMASWCQQREKITKIWKKNFFKINQNDENNERLRHCRILNRTFYTHSRNKTKIYVMVLITMFHLEFNTNFPFAHPLNRTAEQSLMIVNSRFVISHPHKLLINERVIVFQFWMHDYA